MPKRGPIQSHILTLLGTHHIRMTPADLERALRRQLPGIRRSEFRQAVKSLVAEGSLLYTNHFSTTHLEQNHNRPVHVSDRILLCPANCAAPKGEKLTIIRLQDGTAFGVGDHPTTRLCIRGLDVALTQKRNGGRLADMTALDIGTGSAVLAITAIALGLRYAVGIDIDPMACSEAKRNVALNGMTKNITISSEPVYENDAENYDLILANLRPPTLKQLFPVMKNCSKSGAIWVLSGFRQEEEQGVENFLPANVSNVEWRSQERGWAGMVLTLNAID